MSDQHITERATIPRGYNPVLECRTVENANQNLLTYLKTGLSVLDVGCGSGAITRSIAEKTGQLDCHHRRVDDGIFTGFLSTGIERRFL